MNSRSSFVCWLCVLLTLLLQRSLPSAALTVQYRFLKWRITRTKEDCDNLCVYGTCTQVSIFTLKLGNKNVSLNTSQRVIENPGGSNPPGEGPENIVSNLMTKWIDTDFGCCQNCHLMGIDAQFAPGISELIFDAGPDYKYTFDGYQYATANDYPGRDPADWKFFGSTDNATWILLDDRCGFSAPESRFNFTQVFSVTSGSPRPTPTGSSSSSITQTPTKTSTPTTTTTMSQSVSSTKTSTDSSSASSSPTASATTSPSNTRTPTKTFTSTFTPTPTPTRTASCSLPSTPTQSATPTTTPSPSRTMTPTSTSTFSSTLTVTQTITPTRTSSPTRTQSPTTTLSATASASSTVTQTRSETSSSSPSVTMTPTRTSSSTPTPSCSGTVTASPSLSPIRQYRRIQLPAQRPKRRSK
eukprot:gb/GECG01008914.1/.p1 GENE.gb/GECG01008914.1/~~gb/GECG01008914.1/.p1  ORF type:complete len:413 (+),score=24.39 gb/GECG01008914.1/:1-1239(+)